VDSTGRSCTLIGIDAELVVVDCTIDRGLPQSRVAGVDALSVRDDATRIPRARKAVAHDLLLKKVTINLARADLRRLGSGLELPSATRGIDRRIARTIADRAGQDDIDARCRLEAATYHDAAPTANLVPHAR
jgi:predicted ATPase with chaperone activity